MKKIYSWEYKTQDGQIIGVVDRLEPEQSNKSSKLIIPRFNKDNQGYFIKGIPNEIKGSIPLYGLDTLKRSEYIYIVEGEKCASALSSLGFSCLTSQGGSKSAYNSDWSIFKELKDRSIILLPDNDEAGIDYMRDVYRLINETNPSLEITCSSVKSLSKGCDFCDWADMWIKVHACKDWNQYESLNNLLSLEELKLIKSEFKEEINSNTKGIDLDWKIKTGSGGLKCISLSDLLSLDIPKAKDLLSPWLTEQSLTMIYANRGVGKTYFALNCAYALASSGKFLKYSSSSKVPVCYIDGEMQAPLMIERLNQISGSKTDNIPINIITPDLQDGRGMPDLSTEEGQKELDEMIERIDAKVIFVDNLSTLCRSGQENDSESWIPVQTWAIRHRSQGRSIVFIHHANKSGGQRGTSKKEDVLDNVIFLQRPEDYDESTDGAKFEVLFEKSRSLHGDDVAPIVASLLDDGSWKWEQMLSKDEQVLEMYESGLKQKEIAKELGLSTSCVCKMIKKAKSKKK